MPTASKAGQHRRASKIYNRDVPGRRGADLVEPADLADPSVLDPESLIGPVRAGAHVDRTSCPDEHRPRRRRLRTERRDDRHHTGPDGTEQSARPYAFALRATACRADPTPLFELRRGHAEAFRAKAEVKWRRENLRCTS